MTWRRLAVTLLLGGAFGCGQASEPEAVAPHGGEALPEAVDPLAVDPDTAGPATPDLAGWDLLDTDGGRHQVAWRSLDGELARNVERTLEVMLLVDGVPAEGRRLVVRGSMPAHGHGFVRAPRVSDQGGGRFRVDSVLLHMRGHWLVLFDVTDAQGVETATLERDV